MNQSKYNLDETFLGIDQYLYLNVEFNFKSNTLKYSLDDGLTAISLYFYYRYVYSKDELYLNQSAKFLTQAINTFFKAENKNISLHYGLSGIVFTYNLLVKNDVIVQIITHIDPLYSV